MYQQLIDSLLSVQSLNPEQNLPYKIRVSQVLLRNAILKLEQSTHATKKPFLEAMKLLLKLSEDQHIPANIHTDNTPITPDLKKVILYFHLQWVYQLSALCLKLEDLNRAKAEGFDFSTGNIPILNAITQSYYLVIGVIKPAHTLEIDKILVILRQLTGQDMRPSDELLSSLQERRIQNDKFNQIFGLIWNAFFHEHSKVTFHAISQSILLYCELISIKHDAEFLSWKTRMLTHLESNPLGSLIAGIEGSLRNHMDAMGFESLGIMQAGTGLMTQCRYLLYLGIMHSQIEKEDMVAAQQLYSRFTLGSSATTQPMTHDSGNRAAQLAPGRETKRVSFSDALNFSSVSSSSAASSSSSSSSMSLSMNGSDN